jgi:hypothetical protein
MLRIQRFNVIKAATVAALMYMIVIAIFVVPLAAIVLIASVAGVSVDGTTIEVVFLGGFGGIFAYGLIGWIATAIACVIYNLVAGWIGGIEVRVEPVAPEAPPPAWMAPQPPTSQQPPTSLPPTSQPPSGPAV